MLFWHVACRDSAAAFCFSKQHRTHSSDQSNGKCLQIEGDELDDRYGEVHDQRADEVHLQHAVSLQRVLQPNDKLVSVRVGERQRAARWETREGARVT